MCRFMTSGFAHGFQTRRVRSGMLNAESCNVLQCLSYGKLYIMLEDEQNLETTLYCAITKKLFSWINAKHRPGLQQRDGIAVVE